MIDFVVVRCLLGLALLDLGVLVVCLLVSFVGYWVVLVIGYV